MKNKTLLTLSIITFVILIILLFFFLYEEQPIGGQRDAYGCLSPAGYTYNETLDVCVREWELNQIDREVIKLILPSTKEYGLTIINVSKDASCLGCFRIKLDVLGDPRTIGIYSWNLINTTLSPTACLEKGGRNLNVVAGDSCFKNETNIAKVIGFISPNICCIPNTYCGEDRGDYCIQVWEPVCGFGDFGSKTFSNSCVACQNISVEYHVPGECPL